MPELLDKLADALKKAEIELCYAQNLDDPDNMPELQDALYEINGLRIKLLVETRSTMTRSVFEYVNETQNAKN
jgi:hypothetical protein